MGRPTAALDLILGAQLQGSGARLLNVFNDFTYCCQQTEYQRPRKSSFDIITIFHFPLKNILKSTSFKNINV